MPRNVKKGGCNAKGSSCEGLKYRRRCKFCYWTVILTNMIPRVPWTIFLVTCLKCFYLVFIFSFSLCIKEEVVYSREVVNIWRVYHRLLKANCICFLLLTCLPALLPVRSRVEVFYAEVNPPRELIFLM
jgi:hypothetical protein